jgi:hypothetical protein
MGIVLSRTLDEGDGMGPYWEAHFDPEQCDGEGFAFAVRVYDASPGTPYKPEYERCGMSSEQCGWGGYEGRDALVFDEEQQLFDAILKAKAA